jgi:nitrite reductase (NADH) large subunit
MAESVARRLTGHSPEPFDGADTSTALKLLGVQIAAFGATRPDDGPAVEAVFADGSDRYAKIFLSRHDGALLGGILAGDTGSWTTVRSLVGRRPPADLERLLLP